MVPHTASDVRTKNPIYYLVCMILVFGLECIFNYLFIAFYEIMKTTILIHLLPYTGNSLLQNSYEQNHFSIYTVNQGLHFKYTVNYGSPLYASCSAPAKFQITRVSLSPSLPPCYTAPGKFQIITRRYV